MLRLKERMQEVNNQTRIWYSFLGKCGKEKKMTKNN